jgi:hypothetical protein
MPDISAAIRNAVSEKTAEIQRLADQLEDILYQAGLAQRRGSHKDSRCEDISPPYTFFLLNGDMELYRNRHLFI